MRLSQFDLNQLVALDALLTEISVSKAGDRVFLSESAMSTALKRLRLSFRDQLLVPVGRKMILTPLARELARPVQDILLQIRAVMSMRREFNPSTSQETFSVLVSDYAGTVFGPAIVRRVALEGPNVKIKLRLVDHSWVQQLERGETDLVIVPEQFALATHPKEILFRDTYSCIVWSQNRRVKNRISQEQYMAMGHAVMEFKEERISPIDTRFLQKTGFSRRVEVTAPYFTLLPMLVVGTNRIATLHTQLAKLYAKYLDIRIIPFPFSDPPSHVSVIQYPQHLKANPAHEWFRGIVKSVSQELAEGRTKAARRSRPARSRPRRRGGL
jgi:LysR family nod box-dependent transcriptional activator